MEIIITPLQLPVVNTLNLNHYRRSAYWVFIIWFLGIISFAILGLYAISAYERSEQARVGSILNDINATKFLPTLIEQK